MTSAPERPVTRRGPTWEERSLLRDRAGLPWWAAVGLALVLTALGVFADLQRLDRLGAVFQGCFFLGCLLAVAAVRRASLFGPMVQPPLLFAVTVPGVMLLTGSLPTGDGTTSAALALGTPLVNGFPAMAITTAATLALSGYRLVTERRPGNLPAVGAETAEQAAPVDPDDVPTTVLPAAQRARQRGARRGAASARQPARPRQQPAPQPEIRPRGTAQPGAAPPPASPAQRPTERPTGQPQQPRQGRQPQQPGRRARPPGPPNRLTPPPDPGTRRG